MKIDNIKQIPLLFFSVILLISLASCGLTTTRPKEEMSYAATAFLAARSANAATYAPNLYRKAELYYLKAKSSYKRKYFNKAKQYANLSKQFSEQAEFLAIKKASSEGVDAIGE